MPNNFRNISIPNMLYETLTGFYSITGIGTVSWLYKFCAACLSVLQTPFNDFVTFRTKEYIIANCKFTIGQLTNVLNYLYDPIQKRITITQSTVGAVFFWKFAYPPSLFLSDFGTAPSAFLETFGSRVAVSTVAFNVPAGIDLIDLTATIAQISIAGIPYKIVTI